LTEYLGAENEGGEIKKLPSGPNKSKIKFINHAKKKPLFLPAALHSAILSDGFHFNMMLPQVVESLTVTNVLGSSPQIYSEQLHTQFSSSTNFKRTPKPPAQELYVQIKDEVTDEIIKHGLSKVESKLFFYLLKLDRFGDRPVKVKVAEILLATGVGKSVYHTAIAKFERMGWFGFKPSDVEISNFCTPTKKSEKSDSYSEKSDSYSEKSDSYSEKSDSYSEKSEFKTLKPLPAKTSKTPQTLQTYSNLLNTLSEDQRESFKKFCLKKIQECSFKIGSKEAWLNKHGAEYLEEFKETYSYALANPEVIPPKAAPFDIPDISDLKRFYGDGWKDAAIHFGLIDPNSPEEEIQNESEPVTASEMTPKLIADSENPQEPTPKLIADSESPQEPTPKLIADSESPQEPTPKLIADSESPQEPTPPTPANHEQFAEGDRVVIAEVGNTHYGKTGKIIVARFRSQDDKYIIVLDRKSPSAREVTIKIPKACKLTYLTKL
jgi:hypothetical protein